MQIFSILLLVCVSFVVSAPPAKYTNKYDNINIDMILQNDRVLNNYIKCLMDEGPCTSEGRDLRKTLPDALSNGCNKCNEKQQQASEKVISHLVTKRKRDWERLTRKYDPKGEYKKRYEQTLKNNLKS